MGNKRWYYVFISIFIILFSALPCNSELNLMDLPAEIQATIIEKFIPEEFESAQQIIDTIQNIIYVLMTNSQILRFKEHIFDKLPRIIKERAAPPLIIHALQKALNERNYSVLKTLFSADAASVKNRHKLTMLGSLIKETNERNVLGWSSIRKLKRELEDKTALFFIGLSKAINAGYDPVLLLESPTGLPVTIKKKVIDAPPFIASIYYNIPLLTEYILLLAKFPEVRDELQKEASTFDSSILHLLINQFFSALHKKSALSTIWLSVIMLLFQITTEDHAFINYLLETPEPQNNNTPLARALYELSDKPSHELLKLINLLYNQGKRTHSGHLTILNNQDKTAQKLLEESSLQKRIVRPVNQSTPIRKR